MSDSPEILDYILWLLYAVLALIGLVAGYKEFFNWQKASQGREERVRVLLEQELSTIQKANHEFYSLTSIENGFFSNHALEIWNKQYSPLFKELHGISLKKAKLDAISVDAITQFMNTFTHIEGIRETYNARFIASELITYASFFDNIENRKLDQQQRLAILSDEDNGLVIAGAGSGKTTTIVGKVSYVIDRYKVSPNEILLISFTRKSAHELAKRINVEGIVAKTFHRFGMDIITDVENRQPSIYNPEEFGAFIEKTFRELLQNEAYLELVTNHFVNFSGIDREVDSFEDQGQYFQYLQDQNFESFKLKETSRNGHITYRREVVKSMEECKIANFLLLNSIDYEYELPYEHDTATRMHRQYKPDFTINPKGKRIYIEHFGVNKEGKVPKWFAKEDEGQTWESATKAYQDGMSEKRQIHQKHGTTLIETYSYEAKDSALFDNLTEKLQTHGIKLVQKTPAESWKIISKAAKDEVENIIKLFETFISLLKSNNYSIEDILKRNAQTNSAAIRNHNASIIRIVEPIYNKYQQFLSDSKQIDLNDAINVATEFVTNQKYTRKFRYIIIDEFQDISIGRYKLIQALKQNNPNTRLFAVGDDWQSIYRFTGSDISLFNEFENYFGHTIKSRIETTYRFKDPVISISSNFILKNRNQEKKTLRAADKTKKTDLEICYTENEDQDDTETLKKVFDDLSKEVNDLASKSVLILGRYSFDLRRIKNEMGDFIINGTTGEVKYKITKNLKETELTAQYLTVHKSKGLEADIVIVINCNTGTHGFPTEMSDDPVLNLLLSDADQFDNSEERRLFYVALTRAKERVYLITDKFYKSKFISELETSDKSEGKKSVSKKCPRCKTADLILRRGETKGKIWSFYGCKNYIYGCNYIEWIKK